MLNETRAMFFKIYKFKISQVSLKKLLIRLYVFN
jgi:hypothetical protein